MAWNHLARLAEVVKQLLQQGPPLQQQDENVYVRMPGTLSPATDLQTNVTPQQGFKVAAVFLQARRNKFPGRIYA